MTTIQTESVTSNKSKVSARVARHRAKYKHIDYAPLPEVLEMIERVKADRGWQYTTTIDTLIRVAHDHLYGDKPDQAWWNFFNSGQPITTVKA